MALSALRIRISHLHLVHSHGNLASDYVEEPLFEHRVDLHVDFVLASGDVLGRRQHNPNSTTFYVSLCSWIPPSGLTVRDARQLNRNRSKLNLLRNSYIMLISTSPHVSKPVAVDPRRSGSTLVLFTPQVRPTVMQHYLTRLTL